MTKLQRATQSDAALDASEARFSLLFEHSGDAIFMTDLDGGIVEANQAALDLFRVRRDQLPGLNAADLYADPADRAAFRLAMENEGGVRNYELQLRAVDGTPLVGLYSAGARRAADGSVIGYQGIIHDITERKRVEQEARQLSERLLSAERVARIGNWLWDIETDAIIWSDQIFRIFGLEPGEVAPTYAAFLQRIPPDDRVQVEAAVREAVEGDARYDIDHRILLPDGRIRMVHEQAEVVRSGDGRAVAMQGTVQDITDRWEVERRLEANERRYRSLIENGSDVITLVDPTGRIEYESPSIARVLGYEPGELVGQSIFERVHPDDQEHARSQFSAALEDAERTLSFELRFLNKAGEWRWLEVRGRNQLGDPAVGSIVVNSRDITDRKNAEQMLLQAETRFRGVVEQSVAGIYILEGDRLSYVNPRMAEIFGYEPDGLIGRPVLELVAEEDRARVAETVRARAEGRIESAHYTLRGLHRDGFILEIEVHGGIAELESRRVVIGALLDVTSRVRAEEELLRSEVRLARILETITDAVTLVDREGQITYANAAAEQILGLEKSRVQGRTYDDPAWEITTVDGGHFPPEELPFTRVMSTGSPVHAVEHAIRHLDGRRVILSINAGPLRDTDGGITGMVASIQDITARKRAEEELRSSEERFRLAYEHAPIGMALTTPEGMLMHANRAFGEMLGYTAEEMRELSIRDITHPEDLADDLAAMERVLSGHGDVYELEKRYLRRDGSVAWVHLVGSIVRSTDGSPRQFVKQMHDITAGRQAQEERERLLRSIDLQRSRLQEVFDRAPSFLAIVRGPAHTFELANDEYRRLVGQERELLGQPLLDALPEIASQGFKEILDQVLDTREPFVGHEVPVRLARRSGEDPEERVVTFVYQPMEADNAGPSGVIVHGIDVTELVRSRETVEAMNRTLEQRVRDRTVELTNANRELEAFSYSVSHDLRGPLRALDGISLAVLEDYEDALDETGQDYLRRIREASQTMGRLIDDLLKLSRINRGSLAVEEVDLAALARQKVEDLRGGDPKRAFDLVAPDRLVATGDARLLALAVDNLVANAWKFTRDSGNARVEIGIAPEPDGTSVYFIRDNGVGFDMKYAERLFGAFQRLHSSSQFEGTGIGLATVQRIIHRHGGRIWADAAVGNGATFYFTLEPRQQ